jgi:hypothetical protein
VTRSDARCAEILSRGEAHEIVAYAAELLMVWQSNGRLPSPDLVVQLRHRLTAISDGLHRLVAFGALDGQLSL